MNRKHLWLIPAFFLSLTLPVATVRAAPAESVLEDTEKSEQFLEPEIFRDSANPPTSNRPVFEIHGDYRWLFG